MAGRDGRVCVLVLTQVAVYLASVSSRHTSQGEGCQGDEAAVSSLMQSAGCSPACLASAFSLCPQVQGQNLLSTFTEEVRDMLREMRSASLIRPVAIKEGVPWRWRPRNCMDLLHEGDSGQGVRQVFPFSSRPHQGLEVYCDQTNDNGGWTVVMRRTNSTVREHFYRPWVDYEEGFGNITSEFWMGLKNMNVLSSSIRQECRIQLADYEGNERWAKYSTFKVGPSHDHYRLNIEGYTGDAGDALTYNNNNQFSTLDADHDTTSAHCAQAYTGAMWYRQCTYANPNGFPYEGAGSPSTKGITWSKWKGQEYSLRKFTWMIRPVN